MIRRDRHASADDLASLAVGELRPRRAAKVRAHLSACDRCTRVRQQLDDVPVILSSASYPPIPENLSVRIEAAIHAEARQELAAMPATEAGRRDLPSRHSRRAQRQRRGWRLPGLSGPATRAAATVAAAAVVAVGGYEIAIHAGSSTSNSTSSVAGSAAGPAHGAQAMSLGPEVTYGSPGALHTIHVVRSSANFVAPSLVRDAVTAVHAARARGASVTTPSPGSHAPARSNPAAGSAGPAGSGAAASGLAGRLAGCLDHIAPGRTAVLLDLARYQGKPAILIVVAATGPSPAEVWVVGTSCSATVSDVLAHTSVGNL